MGRILIVNNDIADAIAMQRRLQGVDIDIASQRDARSERMKEYDLIVLDNDQDALQESQGARTLAEMRQRTAAPVLFTSFQPGLVPGEVRRTPGVDVVPMGAALEAIASMTGCAVIDAPAIAQTGEPLTNVIMTYNTVDGYPEGVFDGGRLLIVKYKGMRELDMEGIGSYEQTQNFRAIDLLKERMELMRPGFDLKADRDLIRNVFVYDGINGGSVPGQVAAALGHDLRMRVNMLACRCDWDRKERFRDSMYVDLYPVWCGGQEALGIIADTIMGVTRPEGSRMIEEPPMPLERILQPGQRYRIG